MQDSTLTWWPHSKIVSSHGRKFTCSLRILSSGTSCCSTPVLSHESCVCPIMSYGHSLLLCANLAYFDPWLKTKCCALCIIRKNHHQNTQLIAFLSVTRQCHFSPHLICCKLPHWLKPNTWHFSDLINCLPAAQPITQILTAPCGLSSADDCSHKRVFEHFTPQNSLGHTIILGTKHRGKKL